MPDRSPESALEDLTHHLRRLGIRFALAGGLAIAIRGEVRFTRDVDVVVAVRNDSECEALIRELRTQHYDVIALVEQEDVDRIATVRLVSPSGILVDIITATCGIEAEIVARAEPVRLGDAGSIPVACAEELLAMKILSMTEKRLQDRIDAMSLCLVNADIDIERVKTNLALMTARGYARNQDLAAKLAKLIDELGSERGTPP